MMTLTRWPDRSEVPEEGVTDAGKRESFNYSAGPTRKELLSIT